jgi:glycosyltransferase involved in cell wall biosynthesis
MTGDNDLDSNVVTLPISGSFSSYRLWLQFGFSAPLKIRDLVESEAIQLVHGHSGYAFQGAVTGISSKLAGIPSVQTIYCPARFTTGGHRFQNSLTSPILSKMALSWPQRVIAISNNVQRSLFDLGLTEDRVRLVPPGIDTSSFNPSVTGDTFRESIGIDRDKRVLAYVGNLSRNKGLDVLLDSFNLIVRKKPRTLLLIVLNMPLSEYLNPSRIDSDMSIMTKIKEQIGRYGIEQSVKVVGLIDNMPQAMASMDVMVSPFFNTDGIADYPVTILEAMAAGKPVVASKVGGIPEIVHHRKNGILVEPGDSNKLAEAILYLLDNETEAKRMGRNAWDLISTEYDIRLTAERTVKIYGEVLAET